MSIVFRHDRITQEDMDDLADLANSCPIAGKPYAFVPGNYLSELTRLRLNTFFDPVFRWLTASDTGDVFDVPPKPSLLLSGPWSIVATSRPEIGVLKTTQIDIDEAGTGLRCWGQAPTVAENKYVFSGEAGTLTTFVDVRGFGPIDNYYRSFPFDDLYLRDVTPAKTFQFVFKGGNNPFTMDFFFDFVALSDIGTSTLELFGADSANCTLTITSILGTGPSAISGRVTCTATFTSDFSFEVGIRDSTEATTKKISRIRYGNRNNLRCTLTNTVTEFDAFPAINDASFGSVQIPPSMAAISVYSIDADADQVLIEDGYKYCGNQAFVTSAPSNPGGDFQLRGVWIGKTFPVGLINFFQARSGGYGLNDQARADTIGQRHSYTPFNSYPSIPNQPDIYASPHSCEFMIPSYPIARDTDGGFRITNFPRIDFSGCAIRDVFIRRMPELNDKGIYGDPEDKPELDIEIGSMVSGSFVAFETFTIPEGEMEIWNEVFYIGNALYEDNPDRFKLVYRCSVPVRVEASVNGPLPATFGQLFQESGAMIDACSPQYPIIASHYNDTRLALLETL